MILCPICNGPASQWRKTNVNGTILVYLCETHARLAERMDAARECTMERA